MIVRCGNRCFTFSQSTCLLILDLLLLSICVNVRTAESDRLQYSDEDHLIEKHYHSRLQAFNSNTSGNIAGINMYSNSNIGNIDMTNRTSISGIASNSAPQNFSSDPATIPMNPEATSTSTSEAATVTTFNTATNAAAPESGGQVNECPIDCQNDSECKEGSADFHFHPHYDNGNPLPFHVETSRGGYFCDCPLGLTGISCGRTYETCGTTGHVCYHGGHCIDGLNGIHDKDNLFCQCDDAMYAGNQYVGKFCETAVPLQPSGQATSQTQSSMEASPSLPSSTTTTTTTSTTSSISKATKRLPKVCDEAKSLFCMNGGMCKDDFDLHDDAGPCYCDDNYSGPHCEFPVGQEPPCDLQCANGGFCRIGVQHYDDTDDYYQFWQHNLKNLTYCTCRDGWHGLTCEIAAATVNTCGKDISNDNINDIKYFCVNDGKCKDNYDSTPDENPCDCADGFDGPHCEFKAGDVPACNLECQNGGLCRQGMKTVQDAANYTQYWENNVNYTYCDCPTGYHGVHCDISEKSVAYCGDNADDTFFCINGGTCKDPSNKDTGDYCNCPGNYTGEHCEFKKDEVPTCDLDCQHGGNCKLGMKKATDYDKYFDKHLNFTYCSCQPNFHGVNCEIPSIPCGDDKKCFNHATCVDVGDGDPYCDCSANGTIDATSEKATAGDYCQYGATTYCETSINSYFCVNGGACAGADQSGCVCPPGLSGEVCQNEDKFMDEEKDTECKLQCYNGGKCQKAGTIKSVAKIKIDHPEMAFLNTTYYGNATEACLCKEGYGGHQCETEIEVCGPDNIICLHGSTCTKHESVGAVEDGSKEQYLCDCKDAWTPDSRFAGEFCQHHHTDICAPTGESQYLGSGFSDSAFCVNDGVCKTYVYENQEHAGCDCPPYYTGAHCEFSSDNAMHVASEVREKAGFTGIMVVFFIFIIGNFFAILIVLTLRLRKRRLLQTEGYRTGDNADVINNSIRSISSFSDAEGRPTVNTGELIDNYGNILDKMEEVELL